VKGTLAVAKGDYILKTHTLEQIETMFREMGLGTSTERKRFQFLRTQEMVEEEKRPQLFIRVQDSTQKEQEAFDAKLA
jgi:hypothetical protein